MDFLKLFVSIVFENGFFIKTRESLILKPNKRTIILNIENGFKTKYNYFTIFMQAKFGNKIPQKFQKTKHLIITSKNIIKVSLSYTLFTFFFNQSNI